MFEFIVLQQIILGSMMAVLKGSIGALLLILSFIFSWLHFPALVVLWVFASEDQTHSVFSSVVAPI